MFAFGFLSVTTQVILPSFVRPVVLGVLKSTWIRSGLLFASPRQQAS